MDVSGTTVLLKDCYFYLLYKRKGDEQTQIPILLDKTYDSATDTISASFEPTSYFTEKNGGLDIQVFACSTEQDFISEDVDIEDVALWTSFNAQISIAKSQLKDSQTIVAEDMFTKGIAEMSAYLEAGSEEADAAEEYASDAEEFARGTRSDGLTVPHASTGAHDNAKDYKDLAKDWASKIGGTVESGEYSAKYYAAVADTRSQEAEAYALGTKGGTPVPAFADKNSKDWATKTGSTVDGTNYSSKQYALNAKASADIVEAHATAIDAIYADITNIDAVATDIQDEDSIINTVAENIQDVNAVAESITDVNTVAGKTTQITTVAGISSDVTTVAWIASDVTAVAGIASDVSAVEDIKTDVSAVAAIDADVSAVSAIKDDVSAVATIDDDVTAVATDISDVSAVASDITKVTAVADDLTNIDAVADDLTNIDNAEANALKAEGWANGTQNGVPVTSESPYYENNAKYWADAVPDLKDAIDNNSQRIENLEVAVSGSLVQTNVLTDPPSMANVRTITNSNEILPWAILKRVGARAVAWNQLINLSLATIKAKNTTGTWSDNVYTLDNKTFTVDEANQTVTVNGTAGSSSIQFFLTDNNPFGITHKIWMRGAKDSVNLKFTNNIDSAVTDTGDGRIFTSYANASCIVLLDISASSAPSNVVISPQITDIDVSGLSSYTTSQLKALFPANYPYHAPSIIPLNPSAFKVVGWNKAETVLVDKTSSVYATVLRADGELLPNTTYCLSFVGVAGNLLYPNERLFTTEQIFTATGSRQSLILTTQGVVSKNETAQFNSGGWRLLKNANGNSVTADFMEVCINLSQTDTSKPLHNGVYEAYKETTIDTSQISDGHYVNESCYDYVENVVEEGVIKGKFHDVAGKAVITDFTYQGGTSGGGLYWAEATVSIDKTIKGLSNLPVTTNNDIGWNSTTPIVAFTSDTKIRLYGTFTSQSAMETQYADLVIHYAKKTETIIDVEPISNFPVEDGTTITAVTPQTDLVNSIDVPSTIAYMTKIGG